MSKDISKVIEAGIASARKAAEEYVADNYSELEAMTFGDRAEAIADEVLESRDFQRLALNIGIEFAGVIKTEGKESEAAKSGDNDTAIDMDTIISKKCCICGKDFGEFGNNPWPFSGYKCCDECNDYLVVPARKELARVRNGNVYTLAAKEEYRHAVVDMESRNANNIRGIREAYKSGNVEIINVD